MSYDKQPHLARDQQKNIVQLNATCKTLTNSSRPRISLVVMSTMSQVGDARGTHVLSEEGNNNSNENRHSLSKVKNIAMKRSRG